MPATPASRIVGCESGGVIAAGRNYVSAYWRDLPSGWHDITPTVGAKPPAAINAFSGITLDSTAGKLHWFGGGHADYWGEEVWELDLENRTSFSKHTEPTVGRDVSAATYATMIDNVNYPGALVLPGGVLHPQSRHTGNSQCWVPSINKFFVEGSSTYSGNSAIGIYLWLQNGGPAPMDAMDRWLYSPYSKTWDYEGSDYNSVQINRLAGKTVYHHGRGLLYALGAVGSALSIQSWNPATKAVTTVSTLTVGSTSRVVGAIDDANDCAYLLVFSSTQATPMQLRRYDFATNTWSQITLTGDAPDSYSGSYPNVEFSTRTGRLLLLYNSTGGMRSIDPVSGNCVLSTIAPTSVNACFNNWRFCRRRKVAFFSHATLGGYVKIWAFKE